MSLLYALLAAGSTLPTLIQGAPLPITRSASNKRNVVSYTQFTGTGHSLPWPPQSAWASFDDLFSGSESIIAGSCTQFGAANPSVSEISDLKDAITTVARESGLPAEFIFTVMMQESNGCVRAPTTNNGVRNPGLMQDHDGSASCNDGAQINPCPKSTITQMIRDGVRGTPQGDGLEQLVSQTGDSSVAMYYKAARMYNSGSVAASGNLEDGIATHCYSSDIANRLMGWSTAPHGCNLDGASVSVNTQIPDYGSPPSMPTPTLTSTISTPVEPTTAESPTSTATEVPPQYPFQGAPFSTGDNLPNGVFAEHGAKEAVHPAPTTASAVPAVIPASSSSSTAPLGPGVSSSCKKLYEVVDGDYCYALGEKFGFTFAQFRSWNTQIDAQCSNLWKGYQYCIGN